jgi:hypothetical protein
LSKLDLSRSSISIPDKFTRLDAPPSMLNIPPTPKGLEAAEEGPHVINGPGNLILLCDFIKTKYSLFTS